MRRWVLTKWVSGRTMQPSTEPFAAKANSNRMIAKYVLLHFSYVRESRAIMTMMIFRMSQKQRKRMDQENSKSQFDVSMGANDGAEICELVELIILTEVRINEEFTCVG